MNYTLNLVDCLLIEKHQNNFTLGRRDKIIEGKDALGLSINTWYR